jgi:hypothetical protein
VGKLAPHTINQYRWRLKKLRAVLPIMDENDPERPRVIGEIEKLTNQLGMEMNDLEIALARGPGRPRKLADISEHEAALASVTEKEIEMDETPHAKELRVKKKFDELKARVLAANPDLAAQKAKEDESEKALNEMIQKANEALVTTGGDDGVKGHNKATDDAGEVDRDRSTSD